MRHLRSFSILALALVGMLDASVARAQIPRLLNFQGRLTNAAGTPLTGPYAITFRIWTASGGGTACFTETHPAVTVNGGLFNVVIGSATQGGISSACTFISPHFLDIQVGSDEPMAPRLALTPAAYSFNADLLDGVDSSSLARRNPATGDMIVNGKLGVGTTNPSQRIDVTGKVVATGLCMGMACRTDWPMGTVTQVSAGTAVIASPNPITSTGTLSVDTTIMQARISGTCANGGIRVVNANGTVTCTSVPTTGYCYSGGYAFSPGMRCCMGVVTYECQTNGTWYLYGTGCSATYRSCQM